MKKLFFVFNSLFSFITFLSMLFFGLISFERSQMPYNEEGQYFDASAAVIYDQDAYVVYVLIAILSGIAFVSSLILLRYLRSKGS